jgi:hypothetical protein
MCELGHVDVLVPVVMLSHYLAAPRDGHLNQVFHVFTYLKGYDWSTMVFDDSCPEFDNSFVKCE